MRRRHGALPVGDPPGSAPGRREVSEAPETAEGPAASQAPETAEGPDTAQGPGTAQASATPRLRRDGVTLSLHGVFGAWGWYLFALGPIVPLLRLELDVSLTVAGLHPTALALGSVLVAAATVPLLRRLRRSGTLLAGLALVVTGVAGLTLGPLLGTAGLAVTLSAMLLTGVAGTLLTTGVNATSQAHHGPAAPGALSETNAWAALAGLLSPLVVGAGVAAGLTYRPALLATVPLVAAAVATVLWASRRADTHGALAGGPPPRGAARARPLPRRFWVVMVVLLSGIAVEFVHMAWAAELLRERTPLGEGGSSAAVAAVVGGMAAGRFAAVPLSRRVTVSRLLAVATGTVAVGWVVLWLSTAPGAGWALPAVVALAVSGLGIAAFFPIGSAWLVRSTDGQAERGLARLALGSGVAIGSAPFLVGLLADLVGVWLAFLVVPAILALALSGIAVLAARGHRA